MPQRGTEARAKTKLDPRDRPGQHGFDATLAPRHRRWLAINQGVFPALLNVVLNGGIAWLVFRTDSSLRLWGESGVAIDLVATGFLLPFATCLINSRVIPRQVENGRVPALETVAPLLGLAGSSSLTRALTLAAAGVALGSLPLLALIAWWEPVSLPAFVGVKAVWAGLLAAAISPIVAWWALVRSSAEARGPVGSSSAVQ